MIDCGNRFVPGQASILRRLDKNPAFRTRRFGDANSDERKMSMVSRAIGAEVNRVVTLRQTFWILDWDRLPGFAAIHRDIVITSSARPWKATGLKRSRDNVGGILRIDGDRDFSRVDCVSFSDPYHSLSESNWGSKASNRQSNRQPSPGRPSRLLYVGCSCVTNH